MNKNKTLLQRFTEFNATKRLANKRKKTLLTVSGGMDSVVMCHLFHQAGLPFGIAHCNFQLRGAESDGDEELVRELGKKYKVPVFVRKFDTAKYAEQQGISIQLAARKLRYEWFEELRVKEGFQLIATAHHLNDTIETIFYNLIKGTGIRGLRGIPVRQGNIIRPMLFATREEIETCQKENQLNYREDSSNASDKYTRNNIRHNLIPLMKEINPSLEATFLDKLEVFGELEELYEKQAKKGAAQLFLKRENDIYIPIAKIRKTKNASTILFEYLKEHGFTIEQVQDMLTNLDSIPGKQFLTARARIIKDRKFFILTELPEKDFTIKQVNETDTEVSLGSKTLKLSTGKETTITPDPSSAYIDKGKLKFPLTVRKWKQGDYFYPFGMKMKKKKLKKFLTDEKVPLHEKENCWVLESDQRIVWVVGYRMDERFCVTASTTEILKIKI